MITLAIIGAGIGAQHLTGYRALPDRFGVHTVCDLDLDRAAAAIGADSEIRLTDDLASVLADPAIDLIDICLPPHLHFPVAVQALKAGKHVVCEKPLVRSLAEVDALEAAAQAAGKRVFPIFQYRYGPATAQLDALIAAGLTGKPYAASAETHWNRGRDYYDIPWRGTWAGEAGGAVLGHAIHAHDLLCHFLGQAVEVFALTETRVNQIETEDCAAITMRMETGALVTSSVTLGAASDTSRIRMCFEGVTAESGSAPYTPAEDGWTFTARAPVTQSQIDTVLAAVETDIPCGFAGYLAAVADALDGTGGREVTLADGRASIALVSAIYKSARQGTRVTLPLAKSDSFYDGWLPDQP
jgi:predicted dehydrogenase